MDVIAVAYAGADFNQIARIAAGAVIGGILGAYAYFTYLLYRVHRVAAFRSKILDSDGFMRRLEAAKTPDEMEAVLASREESLRLYETLPSFDTMVDKCWVWPLDKFLSEEMRGDKANVS